MLLFRLLGHLSHLAGLSPKLQPIAQRDSNPLRSRLRQALEVFYASRVAVNGWFNVPGTRLLAYGNLADELVRPIVWHGHVAEGAEVRHFRSFLGKDSVILDIGANVGLFALRVVDLCAPSGAIYLFEPNPSLFAYLRRTVARNAGLAIKVFPYAITDRSGQARFHVPAPAATGHGSLERHEWGVAHGIFSPDSAIAVTTRSVDDMAGELALSRIDAIKIDVEGTEEAVVRGMVKTLRKYKPAVVLCETTKDSDAYRLLEAHYSEVTTVDESSAVVQAADVPASYWGNFFFAAPRCGP